MEHQNRFTPMRRKLSRYIRLKNSNNNFGNLNLPLATAPLDCLQYFTATQGQVSSFNWKDAALAPRQLVGQDYNICFRAELINSQV